ncbi:MAG: hypothetical protein QOJ45_1129 [Verrucomicrobiota bacterium]
MILPMRATLRFLVCLFVSCSIAFAVIPAQAPVRQIEKASCCAKMKAEMATDGCGHHEPNSDPDKQACSGCIFCLAAILSVTTPFVFPPQDEESFATFTARELVRSQRPHVPPPRPFVA